MSSDLGVEIKYMYNQNQHTLCSIMHISWYNLVLRVTSTMYTTYFIVFICILTSYLLIYVAGVQCPSPPSALEEATLEGNDTLYNDVISETCNEGFMLPSGNVTLRNVCTGTKTWSQEFEDCIRNYDRKLYTICRVLSISCKHYAIHISEWYL